MLRCKSGNYGITSTMLLRDPDLPVGSDVKNIAPCQFKSPRLKDARITLNTGNQLLFTFVTDPNIERSCKKFLKVEEYNEAKFGKLSQTRELE